MRTNILRCGAAVAVAAAALVAGLSTGRADDPASPSAKPAVPSAKPDAGSAPAKADKPAKGSATKPASKAGPKGTAKGMAKGAPKSDTKPAPAPAIPAVDRRPLTSVAFRPDGGLLAAGGDGQVILLRPADGVPVSRITGIEGAVTGLGWSADGRRLWAAVSDHGRRGELLGYDTGADGLPAKGDASGGPVAPAVKVRTHRDTVQGLAVSSDGTLAATASYDKLVKLWNLPDGKPGPVLTDHSDSVYAVAFRPTGGLLATVAADRTVKVWRIADGVRLYTLGEAVDWLYGLAWSPDGKRVAAGGVDRSLRVWEADENAGKLAASNFAHDGPVLRLAWSPDGNVIWSVGEDRTLKSWAPDTLREVHAPLPLGEIPHSLALSRDGSRLAVGLHDGTLVLVDGATGKVLSKPLPARPEPPVPPAVTSVRPDAAVQGSTVDVVLTGSGLSGGELTGLPAGAKVERIDVPAPVPTVDGTSGQAAAVATGKPAPAAPQRIAFRVVLPAGSEGVHKLAVRTPVGTSMPVNFVVDPFPALTETTAGTSRSDAQVVTLPVTVAGGIDRDGDVDSYAFHLRQGQEFGVRVLSAELGGKLNPRLELTDPSGRVAAEGSTGTLGHRAAVEGRHVLRVRDGEYLGGADRRYRLWMGAVPVVSGLSRLSLRAGEEVALDVGGVNLAGVTSVKVRVPADAVAGSTHAVDVVLPSGKVVPAGSVLVSPVPTVVGERDHDTPSTAIALAVPGAGEGTVSRPGAAGLWKFAARKGEMLVIETEAARFGSPLDSLVDVLDARGRPVVRAVLRCVCRTAVTFRDVDAVNTGIRLEHWAELAVDDLLHVNGELIRIRALPKNPDDDMRAWSVRGRRLAWMDTTSAAHADGEPIYKVSVHPAGSSFPPNGMPVFELPYRNDDAAPGGSPDSRLTFTAPADGEYLVRVADVRGQGGPGHRYRVVVRPPAPDFTVGSVRADLKVPRGGSVPVTVRVDRTDGFEGAVKLEVKGLPAGFTAPAVTMGDRETDVQFALSAASEDAAAPRPAVEPVVTATAVINGRTVVREMRLGMPEAVDPGDIVTTVEAPGLTLRPGGTAWFKVTIQRRNGFKGRVPVEVAGLPHGVRVLDIGLNGILITERETTRNVQLYAEPWAAPGDVSLLVTAKREGTNVEHGAPAVALKITPAAKPEPAPAPAK